MAAAYRAFPPGTLPGVLEPYLWIGAFDEALVYGRRRHRERIARVQGIVKGPETVRDTGADLDKLIGQDHQQLIDGLARATRISMYQAAEDAITAAIAAGYRLAQHPEIDMRGQINTDRDTRVEVPCAECRVDLHFLIPAGREA